MNNIILFSTNCPRCKVLESKLNQKNIQYTIINDENEMINRGYVYLPILLVDNEEMDFKAAVDWINNYAGE